MNQPFENAVREHGAAVLRVCRAALGCGPDADDAWSETFLAAFRAWPELDDSTNVEAWLVRVAGRKTVDVVRGRARRAIPTDDEVLHEARAHRSGRGAPPGGERADEHTSDAAPDTEIWSIVGELPEKQRLAIAYHYYGGLTHKETAELTGSTPAAVRRAASDGLDRLRSLMGVGSGERSRGDATS